MTDRPAWLEPALAYIPRWLDYQMRASDQPGCAIAIAYKGEVVLEAAFGHADLVAREALTPRHRFRVASHSKSFTATAIMKLREQGRLTLEDTAGRHVAGLHPDVAGATLAQLLSHTAGIVRDGPDCGYWVDRAPFLDAGALRAELAAAPAIEALTRLKYSNHGFGLLGLVIEAVTGEPYRVWVEREIVSPAGLAETAADVPLPSGARLARGHGGKVLLGRRPVFPGDASTHALAAATGFVSTAADLARFFGQLSPNAERSVLSVASRREMARPQWKDVWSPLPQGYGLGTISGSFEDWDWFGHSGGFQGYITRTLVVPSCDLSISCLTNAVDGLSNLWVDGALAILKRSEQDGPPAADLADWTGRWWSVWGATDLVSIGEKVLLASPGLMNPVLKVGELTLTGPDEARISQSSAFGNFGEPARLLRGADGAIREVQLAGGRLVAEAALVEEINAKYPA
ncbi:MAG TPA: serine hydrolase domain-containing protein [Caulobacteraceae bacterium]|jgi:CubicO group peptidase (beta-lactamase class C family)|nr:serine hydrolase domain-containing protein [Caulobacteraceae bacterium]